MSPKHVIMTPQGCHKKISNWKMSISQLPIKKLWKVRKFMKEHNFFYVALSDGDASLRVRFIDSPIVISSIVTSSPRSQANYTSFSSLHFIISGSITINGKKMNAGQAYYEDSISAEKKTSVFSENTQRLTFAIDGIHHRKLVSDVNITPDSFPSPIDIYNFDEVKKIHRELSDMYPEDAPLDPPQMLTQITAKQYFYRALHCLEDKNIMQLDTFRRKLLVDAESYMRNHFREEISIEDVSAHLSVNRRYLYKLFKKYSGTSPKQYLSNIRISRATELLSTSDLSVTEIALEVGYKDPLQFSAFFKKQTGFSPKKYRELH